MDRNGVFRILDLIPECAPHSAEVERITETVARIGSQKLDERLPEQQNSDEISRLAKTFNHMLGRIQSSVNQLRTVTDAVAHDLRSPVTSIRGTLESALSAESGEQWRDAVGQAIEGLDRVSVLLNTTLDVAEAQAGALHLERVPVDLSEVVAQLVDLYEPAMADRHHEVRTDLESAVVVDTDLGFINRALSNLLENELVHLPDGCQVNIRLREYGAMPNLLSKIMDPASLQTSAAARSSGL